ncbi:MAG: tetratricopeptide repeat protein, partial [Pontiella sp.]|nr:tetratricopeptide repeat protein [Pontiella sp.]
MSDDSNKPAQQEETSRSPEEKARHEELLKHQALEQSEVKEVLGFFQKYAKPAATVIIVVCAFVLINNYFKSQRLKKTAKADAALLQAQTAADYQAVLDNYGSTPSAPLALMGLAQQKFNAGQVAEAEELYSRFRAKYGTHEMASQAELNQITCIEGKGEFSEAARLYDDFMNANPDSHLAPIALLGKARCLEATEQFDGARQVYEDILVNYSESAWAQIAESNLG